MSKDSDNSISFGVGLLAGVLGGVFAGILYAPKSGEESRKELLETAKAIKEKVEPDIETAKDRTFTALERLLYSFETKYNKINSAIKAHKLAIAKEKEASTNDYDY